eukprot:SM000168S02585  [mRNA]  locus=s168:22381:23870:- [translate_table: standard]
MGVGGFLVRPVVILASFAYPSYASFKAVESKSVDAAVNWLLYWIVFALFSVVEYFSSWLLNWDFYNVLKLAFILWLQLPQTKGATVLYTRLVQPQLKQHEDQIDSVLVEGRRKALRVRDWVHFTGAAQSPSSHSGHFINRGGVGDKVLQELEEGISGEKGE